MTYRPFDRPDPDPGPTEPVIRRSTIVERGEHIAQYGECCHARRKSHVRALDGSVVQATGQSQIEAMPGSVVHAYDRAHVLDCGGVVHIHGSPGGWQDQPLRTVPA